MVCFSCLTTLPRVFLAERNFALIRCQWGKSLSLTVVRSYVCDTKGNFLRRPSAAAVLLEPCFPRPPPRPHTLLLAVAGVHATMAALPFPYLRTVPRGNWWETGRQRPSPFAAQMSCVPKCHAKTCRPMSRLLGPLPPAPAPQLREMHRGAEYSSSKVPYLMESCLTLFAVTSRNRRCRKSKT